MSGKVIGDTSQLWEFLAASASVPGDFPVFALMLLFILNVFKALTCFPKLRGRCDDSLVFSPCLLIQYCDV